MIVPFRLGLEGLDYNIGYAEIRYDPGFNRMIASSWQKQKRFSRMKQIGIFGMGILAVLGIVFGFFASDKATRGMYTARLTIGSITLAGLTVLILFAVARSFEWL